VCQTKTYKDEGGKEEMTLIIKDNSGRAVVIALTEGKLNLEAYTEGVVTVEMDESTWEILKESFKSYDKRFHKIKRNKK
jgi:C4-type Zn-finger protein